MKGTLHEDRYAFLIISRSILLIWKIFQTKVVEKLETHNLCSIKIFLFSLNSCCLWDNVENVCRAGQTIDDMAQAQCMLDIYGYKYTLRICNTYCSSTVTMVTRSRLNCLPCSLQPHSQQCIPHTTNTPIEQINGKIYLNCTYFVSVLEINHLLLYRKATAACFEIHKNTKNRDI